MALANVGVGGSNEQRAPQGTEAGAPAVGVGGFCIRLNKGLLRRLHAGCVCNGGK
jgi:hypothetical protein